MLKRTTQTSLPPASPLPNLTSCSCLYVSRPRLTRRAPQINNQSSISQIHRQLGGINLEVPRFPGPHSRRSATLKARPRRAGIPRSPLVSPSPVSCILSFLCLRALVATSQLCKTNPISKTTKSSQSLVYQGLTPIFRSQPPEKTNPIKPNLSRRSRIPRPGGPQSCLLQFNCDFDAFSRRDNILRKCNLSSCN